MFHILPDHFLYSCQLLEKLYIGIVFASCLPLWIISLLLVWRERYWFPGIQFQGLEKINRVITIENLKPEQECIREIN